MSKRWSCGTILDGFEHVMNDAVAECEEELLQQIKDIWLMVQTHSKDLHQVGLAFVGGVGSFFFGSALFKHQIVLNLITIISIIRSDKAPKWDRRPRCKWLLNKPHMVNIEPSLIS